ncbi:oxidoreductase [Stenotrophomonas sp. HITSZ_GD]|uniref:oxidoreductase n=1 Tax=Stenotrophomonas sp. HITSZ_GD TaxID=3037248 RepID=UPI00240DEB10|nr:oxidoreductase [Stenotrophomonas sp. HITSZ_GD]MDG2525979.1 oxidoreductase [Stenotrophomonas sp. HITSZ_GD]
MKDLNLALIGYGYVGRVFHAPLIDATEGLRLHSIVSRHQDAAAAYPGTRVDADRARVLADPDIDAVVIATPNDTHAPIALEALAAGKHVLVDKPFTVDLAQAREVMSAAVDAGRVCSVFQNRRWDADFLTVQQLLQAGVLGPIAEFHSHFDRHRPHVRDRWRESDAPGAGLWFDLGPHLLDQALQLFGRPQAIGADLLRQREGARSDDYFHVVLHYPRLRAHLHAGSLVADARRRFAVHGLEGSYTKDGLDTQEAMLRDGLRPGVAGWGEDPVDGWLTRAGEDGTLRRERVTTVPGDYRRCYAAFRDAVAGTGAPPATTAQALELMALLELAVDAAARGQVLPLD